MISLLVKCLCVVADSSHPTVLESTLPESLLSSLSQLLGIDRSDIQLNVMHLWHKMIDHNNNKRKVPFNTYALKNVTLYQTEISLKIHACHVHACISMPVFLNLSLSCTVFCVSFTNVLFIGNGSLLVRMV